jgi:hypothetical protein
MLRALTRYLQAPDRRVWVDTVGNVATYVKQRQPQRDASYRARAFLVRRPEL